MADYANQSYGSHDKRAAATHEWVHVWHHDDIVGFKWTSIGCNSALGAYTAVHGVTVDARFVFEAYCGFSFQEPTYAIRKDGQKIYTTLVTNRDTGRIEIRLGDKYGECVARMTKTGYVQRNAA